MTSRNVLILLMSFLLLTQACTASHLTENVGEAVIQEINSTRYVATGKGFQFDRTSFDKWVIEATIFNEDYKGLELYYRDHYETKKEHLINVSKEVAEEELKSVEQLVDKKDIETYWMLASFSYWLEFERKIYNVPPTSLDSSAGWDKYSPMPSKLLNYIDQYNLRLVNPTKTRVYDVIVMVSKKTDFVFDSNNEDINKEIKLLSEYKSVSENKSPALVLMLYRFATYAYPLEQYLRQLEGFQLSQLRMKRTKGGRSFWSALHGGTEHRIKDAYFCILTGNSVKLIIHTFYHPNTPISEIQAELRKILHAITLKS